MKNESQQLGEKIIELSGGKTNFKTVKNCMTRVRITYNDLEKVKKEEIENLDGVLGVNVADTFQIIVGPGKSVKVQEAINEILGASTGSEEEPPEEKEFS